MAAVMRTDDHGAPDGGPFRAPGASGAPDLSGAPAPSGTPGPDRSPATSDITTAGGSLHGSVRGIALVRLLMRLKWILWRRSFRKNVGKIVGTVFGGLYGLGGMAALVALVVTAVVLDDGGPLFPTAVRALGTALVLVWLLLPLLAFGIDDSLDPRRLALYPRTARELQPGLLAAAAISLPTLYTVLGVAIGSVGVIIWAAMHAAGAIWMVLAIIAVIPAHLAGIVLCLLLPRAVLAHQASRASSRRGREVGGVIGIVVMLGALYGISLLGQSLDGASLSLWSRVLATGAQIGAWTPFGALFSAPVDLAQGALLPALVRILIGAAMIVLVWLWWRRSIDLAMREALVGDASSGSAKVSALVPRFVRSSAFGAVMGRSLRYWRRDSRYLASIVIMPVMLVFFVAMGLVNQNNHVTPFMGVLLVAAISGITLANEIGFDGPAGWVNITAGLSARANLRGRIAAMAVFTVPFLALAAIVVPLLMGRPDLVPMMLLGALGLMMGGWGASSLIGTIMPYPTAAPGTNPMKDRSSSNASAMIAMALATAAVFVPQLPAVGVAIWGLVVDSPAILIGAGVLSLVIGIVVLLVGLRLAERRLEAHYVDVFQRVHHHV
jgi:ABC-2 type transport system permease protein